MLPYSVYLFRCFSSTTARRPPCLPQDVDRASASVFLNWGRMPPGLPAYVPLLRLSLAFFCTLVTWIILQHPGDWTRRLSSQSGKVAASSFVNPFWQASRVFLCLSSVVNFRILCREFGFVLHRFGVHGFYFVLSASPTIWVVTCFWLPLYRSLRPLFSRFVFLHPPFSVLQPLPHTPSTTTHRHHTSRVNPPLISRSTFTTTIFRRLTVYDDYFLALSYLSPVVFTFIKMRNNWNKNLKMKIQFFK